MGHISFMHQTREAINVVKSHALALLRNNAKHNCKRTYMYKEM